MFVSTHYGGEDLVIKFASGEPWKKVFGPVFIYLNSVVDRDYAYSLWDDAKEQVYIQSIKRVQYFHQLNVDFSDYIFISCLY